MKEHLPIHFVDKPVLYEFVLRKGSFPEKTGKNLFPGNLFHFCSVFKINNPDPKLEQRIQTTDLH